MFPIEFIVKGPPVSWRGKPRAVRRWKEKIRQAFDETVEMTLGATTGEVRVHIRYYYSDQSPIIDPDNLAKPVLDAMERRVYDNDRQICDLRVDRVDMTKPWELTGESEIVRDAVESRREFLLIKISLSDPEP